LVTVFDPLAILLLVSANDERKSEKRKSDVRPSPTTVAPTESPVSQTQETTYASVVEPVLSETSTDLKMELDHTTAEKFGQHTP